MSEAILKCLQLLEACYSKDSTLYSYNTDGIFISNPKLTFKNTKDVKFSTKKIGKAYVTDSSLSYFEKHYRENMAFNDYNTKKGEGYIFIGQAGSGKTTKLCKMVKDATNPLVLSFTNKAIEIVKKRLVSNGMDKVDVNRICHTFDSYFCEWSNGSYNPESIKSKTLFIEEFSMVPNKWMTKIYYAFSEFDNKVYIFGDPNQCEPVEGGSSMNYNYLESEAICKMCSNIQTLEYIESTCRCGKQTYKMLDKFLRYGKVSAYFQPIDKYYKNICYLNSTRIRVNTECCDRFIKEMNKRQVAVEFTYDNKKETYNVCDKMPVLATQNMKDKEIFNTIEFVTEDISNNQFKINNEWFDQKEFSDNFIPSFCVTVYKYQGTDINEPYNRYDVNRMDKKQLYTALSRTTKFEYIHVNNSELNNKYFNRRKPVLKLTNRDSTACIRMERFVK